MAAHRFRNKSRSQAYLKAKHALSLGLIQVPIRRPTRELIPVRLLRLAQDVRYMRFHRSTLGTGRR